jgi:rhodanese-related sulfurtransferase
MTHRPARRPSRPRSFAHLAALVLAVLVAALWLAGCGDDTSSPETATATAPGEGTDTTTSAISSPPVGSAGPEGIGTVVATSDGSGTYVDITPDELAAMLESKDFLLINTHIPYEGEIEQTDLFLPFDQASEQLQDLPADKNAKIVVYCRSDRMSRISVDEWVKAGYTNLYNLDGGFVAWEDAGYELLQK